MKLRILLALALIALPLTAIAETAAMIESVSDKEFMASLEAYDVEMTSSQREMLLDFIESLPKEKQVELNAFRDNLQNADERIRLREIVKQMDLEGSRAAFAKLVDHEDPIVRFISNALLASGGDSEAADNIYQLIHSEVPSTQQKRLLKAWCTGLGIRAESDTAENIYEHLMAAVSKTPKWKPGDTAPDFEVIDIAGETLHLKQLNGKVVLLHFWATGCGPCMAGWDSLKNELKAFSSEQLVVISVSIDEDRQAFDDAIKKHQLPWHNVFDGAGWGGTLARIYGVNRLPFDIVIDGNGKIRSNEVSDIPRVLSGLPVSDPQARGSEFQ